MNWPMEQPQRKKQIKEHYWAILHKQKTYKIQGNQQKFTTKWRISYPIYSIDRVWLRNELATLLLVSSLLLISFLISLTICSSVLIIPERIITFLCHQATLTKVTLPFKIVYYPINQQLPTIFNIWNHTHVYK